MLQLQVEATPDAEDIYTLRQGIAHANRPYVGDPSRFDFAVVAYDAYGVIIAGAYGEVEWDWCFLDTVWVHPSLRQQGWGRRLLSAVEGYNAAWGIHNLFLMTTSFQARPFYEKAGYQTWAQLPDRPRGYTYYYLLKQGLRATPPDAHFSLERPLTRTTWRFLDAALRADIAQYRPLDDRALAVFARQAKALPGQIAGGLLGYTYWDWFDLRYIWLAEGWRGAGWGKRLLTEAEQECRRRGIHHMVTELADFQPMGFFLKSGFRVFGQLAQRPANHTSYWLQKTL